MEHIWVDLGPARPILGYETLLNNVEIIIITNLNAI